MKIGYIALGMAIDVYIIREYEQVGEFYKYRDIIQFQIKDGVITNIKIDDNPRDRNMHEDWWRGINELDTIGHILEVAFYYTFTDGHVSIGKLE